MTDYPMSAHHIDNLTGNSSEPNPQQACGFAGHHDATATTDAMAAVGSLVLDKTGIIRFCSAAVARLAGTSATCLIGRPIKFLLPQLPFNHDTPGYNAAFARFSSVADVSRALLLNRKDGIQITVDASLSSFKINQEYQFCLELRYHLQAAILLDELQAFERKAALSTETVVITDANGVIVYVNPAFEALTGYGSAEVCGFTPAILKPEMHDGDIYQGLLEMIRAGGACSGIFANSKKNGDIIYQDTVIRPFVDASGNITHLVSIGHDVSQHVQEIARLRHLANHDSLTCLPNRSLLLDRLHQVLAYAIRREQQFAVVIIDVDRFKAINDTLGHEVGDIVLNTVGMRLSSCVRAEDTVARWGGDEFVMLLVDIDSDAAVARILDKVVAVFRQPVAAEEHKVQISVSMGVCLYSQAGEDGHTLLKHADAAMYQAKHDGGNGYYFWNSHREAAPCACAPEIAAEADAAHAPTSCITDWVDRQPAIASGSEPAPTRQI